MKLVLHRWGNKIADELKNDVDNYRVETGAYVVKLLDGHMAYLSFSLCDRYDKISHRSRKHLNMDSFYLDKDGFPYGDPDLDWLVQKRELPYTRGSILKAVNLIAVDDYDSVEIVD